MEALTDDTTKDSYTKRVLKFCSPAKWHRFYTKEFFVAWFAAWNLSSAVTWVQATAAFWGKTGQALIKPILVKAASVFTTVKVVIKDAWEALIDAILI